MDSFIKNVIIPPTRFTANSGKFCSKADSECITNPSCGIELNKCTGADPILYAVFDSYEIPAMERSAKNSNKTCFQIPFHRN